KRLSRRRRVRPPEIIVDDHQIPRLRQPRHLSANGVNYFLSDVGRPAGFVARGTICVARQGGPARPAPAPLYRLVNALGVESSAFDRFGDGTLRFDRSEERRVGKRK